MTNAISNDSPSEAVSDNTESEFVVDPDVTTHVTLQRLGREQMEMGSQLHR